MTDTKVPWWWTTLGEAEAQAAARAIRERHINRGPLCEQLESELAALLGVPHTVVTTSGSMALLLSMLAAGVSPGDEVILPAHTFIAPAHAALLLGATVRLVDVRGDRPLIDAGRIEEAITPRTRAVVAVHLNGMAADVEAVRAATKDRGVAVIEDTAQSLGSRGPAGMLGTLGDCGAFSMGITKLITSGEGGFVATRDDACCRRLRKLRNHGTVAIADNVFDEPGFNFRFNDIQAAVALAQLARLQEKIAAHRRVRAFYADAMADLRYIRLLDVREREGELPIWTEAICPERDRVIALLARCGVEAHAFHPPLNDSPHLKAAGEFPRARTWAGAGLILPSGPGQSEENLRRTADALHEIARQVRTSADSVLETLGAW